MATPKPGDMLEHVHSKQHYWYVGKVPDRHTVVLYSVESRKSYEVGYDEIHQYYNLVDLHTLELTKTYKNTATGSSFTVTSVHSTPETGEKVAFGFYKRDGGVTFYPYYVKEQYFKNWTPVS